MLKIELNGGLNIDRALKILKGKVAKTGQLKALRERQAYIKPSIKRRDELKKAVYIQKLRQQEEKDE